MNKSDIEKLKNLIKYGLSRCKLGLCKNEDCFNKRRDGSAYCQECSNKYKNA